jgi:hypothetical protein
VWRVNPAAEAQPIPKLSARALLGLALAPGFPKQPIAFMYGPQEGLWKTADGGQTWEDLSPGLPGPDVAGLALAPDFADSQVAVAATPAGVLVSRDGGRNWTQGSPDAASLVAFSPDGNVLAVAFNTGDVRASLDLGQTWTPILRPAGAIGKVVALALDDYQQFYIALIGGLVNTLSLWHGKTGALQKVLSRALGENAVVGLYLPPGERTWYAAAGNRVWRFSNRADHRPGESVVFPDGTGESLQALTGFHDEAGQNLLAVTSQRVYRLAEDKAWRPAADFGSERAITLALSANFAKDKTAYPLLLGGSLARLVIR